MLSGSSRKTHFAVPLVPFPKLDTSSEPASAGLVERRQENRSVLPASMGAYSGAGANTCELRDLSTAGAFVASRRVIYTKDAGVRLEFTLPQGFRVNASGRVAWRRLYGDDATLSGYGIQFYGLNDMNREFIQYYLDLLHNGLGAPITDAHVGLCYEVNARAGNQLYVRLTGTLHPLESETLEATVGRAITTLPARQIYVYIDARDIGACSKAALDHMRTWLTRLRHNHQVLGVMVGGDTIGMVQVRRMAREAGVADALVMFTEHADAAEFWGTLVGDVGILSAVA